MDLSRKRPDPGPYEPTYREIVHGGQTVAQAYNSLPPALREIALWAENADQLVFPDDRPTQGKGGDNK